MDNYAVKSQRWQSLIGVVPVHQLVPHYWGVRDPLPRGQFSTLPRQNDQSVMTELSCLTVTLSHVIGQIFVLCKCNRFIRR